MARWSEPAGARNSGGDRQPTPQGPSIAFDALSLADAFESRSVELQGDRARPRDGGPSAGPSRSSVVIGRFMGTVVVTVHGELDVPRAEHLGSILADLIDGQGNLSVTVDLHDASASDGDSLWVFTEAAERARRRGGTVTVNEPPETLHEGLQLRGVDHFVATMLEKKAPPEP